MVEKRKGCKFAFAEPDNENRKIVSMIEYKGQVLVATQKGIYRLEDNKMVRLQIEKEAQEG